MPVARHVVIFFFNDTATTEIYTLSLHDALPIYELGDLVGRLAGMLDEGERDVLLDADRVEQRAHLEQEPELLAHLQIGRAHAELQSRQYLVCRLLLEKKNQRDVMLVCFFHSLYR